MKNTLDSSGTPVPSQPNGYTRLMQRVKLTGALAPLLAEFQIKTPEERAAICAHVFLHTGTQMIPRLIASTEKFIVIPCDLSISDESDFTTLLATFLEKIVIPTLEMDLFLQLVPEGDNDPDPECCVFLQRDDSDRVTGIVISKVGYKGLL